MENSSHEFYSVLIQTSGVIVAIVGGFLASAWINLSSKRAGIQERVADLEREIEFIAQDIEEDRRAAKSAKDSWMYQVDTIPNDVAVTQSAKNARFIYDQIGPKQAALEQAKSQRNHLKQEYPRSTNPDSNMVVAGVALGILIVVGILVPLFLMATTFDDGCRAYPISVFWSFVTGIVLATIYALHRLRNGGDQTQTSIEAQDPPSTAGEK